MFRLYQIFLICSFVYLMWKCLHYSRLLLICEEVQRFNVGGRVQYITKTRPVNYCVGDDASKCVPPLLPYKQKYRVADKYSLLGCVIEKNFSTMLTAILCFLFDEDRFRQNKRNLTTEYYHQRSERNSLD
ncbi:hypothetical protein ANCCAN_08138 [Ancylostoma caninum]|uniref:Uncharacterized protein n=1 Tax=Ancylostoma caninum TaxID=29170 RepID=A0A368GNA1_ANCCA|nr:hypothetical protein ANCCAN_08138 [Ancylostoma caninum]